MISINSRLIVLLLTIISCTLFSCNLSNSTKSLNNNTAKDTMVDVAIHDGHNSLNAVDWVGTYRGTLPCADCEGIETVITLNEDGTYKKNDTYLTNKEGENKFEEAGKFVWDESGSIITLQSSSGESKYKVGENKLFALDMDGKLVEGQLADKYILVKE